MMKSDLEDDCFNSLLYKSWLRSGERKFEFYSFNDSCFISFKRGMTFKELAFYTLIRGIWGSSTKSSLMTQVL